MFIKRMPHALQLLIAATVSLCILFLTLEPLNWWLCAWIAYIPVFIALFRRTNFLSSCVVGYAFGMGLCAFGVFWSSYYKMDAFIKIVFAGGLVYSIFFVLISALQFSLAPTNTTKHLWIRSIIPPSAWLIVFILCHSLPIGSIVVEVPLYQSLVLMQLASIGSIWPVATLVLWWSTAAALFIDKRNTTTASILGLVSLVVVGATLFGWQRLKQNPPQEGTIPIALVQPNFPTDTNWRDTNGDIILETLTSMVLEAGQHNPSIIFLPQYGLPIDPYRDHEYFSYLADTTNATIVLAAYIPQIEDTTFQQSGMFNMGIVYEPKAGLSSSYISVVGPPFRDIGQLHGNEYPEIHTVAGTMGFLLCYEDTVRWPAQEWTKHDIDFFASVTNIGQFDGSTLPEYHFMQDRLRALENTVPVVRITPNGYSGIVDAYGRVRAMTALNNQQILFGNL